MRLQPFQARTRPTVRLPGAPVATADFGDLSEPLHPTTTPPPPPCPAMSVSATMSTATATRRRERGVPAAALLLLGLSAASVLASMTAVAAAADDERYCPTVKAIRHLHLHEMLGHWFVVQYFASSEELPEYRCMRADFSLNTATPEPEAGEPQPPGPRVTMNFTYAFSDDPVGERLRGNITWQLPDLHRPAHWRHQEESYQGVYNTYVLDSDYTTWALLLHCAEQTGSPRYLSSFILSRTPGLPANVQAYLRDKLTRYAIDLDFMFPMSQEDCDHLVDIDGLSAASAAPAVRPPRPPQRPRKHPLHGHHDARRRG